MRKWTTAAVLACTLVFAGAALAASSPTVAPQAVTAIGDTGATLHGTVNPNGAATTYQFSWGTTSALGSVSPATAASAGAGTTAVSHSTKLTGLSPDTTYYYAIVATNGYGTTSTPVETFKTTGNPAPTITPLGASGLGRYVATMNGSISPNNQATTYYFEYGLTDEYGFQTTPKVLAAGTVPVTVSQVMAGIAPGTVFHYRLVASHGSTSTTYGPDETFETYPWPRPTTTTSLTISPSRASKAPFVFKISGAVSRPTLMPTTLGCSGVMKVSYVAGGRQLASRIITLPSTCAYSATIKIGRLPKSVLAPHRTARVSVRVSFRGAKYQAPSTVQKSATVG